jgi:hypothetical protein
MVVMVCRQRTPPSRNSSEGGVGGGGVSTENPSVSRFERGRGVVVMVVVCRHWLNRETTPSVSRFERGRGGGGGGGVSTEKIPPPSRVSSEGGGGDTRRREMSLSSSCRFC